MFKFLYNFLFIDQKTDKISHTKLFSIVGYVILSWAFIHVVENGTTSVDYMLWGIFSIVVIGNRSLIEIMKKGKDKDK